MRTLVGLVTILVGLAAVLLLGLRLAAMIREIGLLPQRLPEVGELVETAEGAIYIEATGPAGGVPVLLVHGSPGWSALWRPTAAALEAEGYRAIAVDMPPFGWSDRDPAGDYSRQAQARRLVALVEALGLRPVLVAHSAGAGPAAEAAMLEPEAFAGLVVVSGSMELGRDGTDRSLPWPLGHSFVRELTVAATLTNPSLSGWILKRYLYRKEAATPEVLSLLDEPLGRPGTTAALADWLEGQLVPPAGALSTTDAGWQALPVPVGLIWGERDTATPPEQGEALAALTGATLYLLPETGHIPQIEAPAEFQAALTAALAEIIR